MPWWGKLEGSEDEVFGRGGAHFLSLRLGFFSLRHERERKEGF